MLCKKRTRGTCQPLATWSKQPDSDHPINSKHGCWQHAKQITSHGGWFASLIFKPVRVVLATGTTKEYRCTLSWLPRRLTVWHSTQSAPGPQDEIFIQWHCVPGHSTTPTMEVSPVRTSCSAAPWRDAVGKCSKCMHPAPHIHGQQHSLQAPCWLTNKPA